VQYRQYLVWNSTFKAAFQFAIENDDHTPVTPDVEIFTAICSSACVFKARIRSCSPLCFQTRILFPGDAANLQTITYGTAIQTYNRLVTRGEFIQIMEDDFGVSLVDKVDYLLLKECCITEFEIVYKDDSDTTLTVEIGRFYDLLYSGGDVGMDGKVAIDECYRYCITDADNNVIACSNLFKRAAEDCFLSVIRFNNNEDAFGFQYVQGIYQVITLPFFVSKPQYPTTKKVYKRSNRYIQTLAASVEKEWPFKTDWMPDYLHQSFVMAMNHDTFQIFFKNEWAGFAADPDYKIEWVERPVDAGQGTGKFKQQLYNYVNDSCGNNTNCCNPPAVEVLDKTDDAVTFKLYPTLLTNVFDIRIREFGATDWQAPIAVVAPGYLPFEFTLGLTVYPFTVFEYQWRSVCNNVPGEWGIIKRLGEGDGSCVPASFSVDNVLPDAAVGVPYHVEIPISGTPPFAIFHTVKPEWMVANIVADKLVFDGVPDVANTDVNVDIAINNCGLLVSAHFKDTIDVTQQTVEMGSVVVTLNNTSGGNCLIRNINTNQIFFIEVPEISVTQPVPYGDYIIESFSLFTCEGESVINPYLGSQFTVDASNPIFGIGITCEI